MGIYIFRLKISSEKRQNKQEKEDEYVVRTYYYFDEETRRKIEAIRVNGRNKIYTKLVKFEEGIYVGTDEHFKDIEPVVEEVDQRLKEIHHSLSAKVKPIPLDDDQIMRGEYYAEVAYAIYNKVLEDFLKRIKSLKVTKTGEISERAKEGLNKLLDSMHEVNFLDDKQIEQRIEEMRYNVLNRDVSVLKEELEGELKKLEMKRESRFTYLEI